MSLIGLTDLCGLIECTGGQGLGKNKSSLSSFSSEGMLFSKFSKIILVSSFETQSVVET